jgi:thiol-disulfide isomerase/thioredoxin
MRKLVWLLYTGLMLGANTGAAQAIDPALLTGDMAKLVIAEGRPVPVVGLVDMAEAPHDLAELKGRWVVLNFWATWCAPCREEMPSLDRLQAAMPDLSVVAVATGPNPVPALERFLDEAGVNALTVWRDQNSALARQMGVLGLPVTVILSAEGVEVARLIGGAEWDSPDAQAVLAAMMQ